MTESKKQQDENTTKPDRALGRLDRLVGRWIMQGRSLGSEEDNITGTTRFKWLHGNKGTSFFLQQDMEMEYAGTKIKSREIIGYDPNRKAYFAPFFDNQGSAGWEQINLDGNTWIWNGENVMGVKYHRCKAVFKNEKTITALHEYSDDNQQWHKWIDITLSKSE